MSIVDTALNFATGGAYGTAKQAVSNVVNTDDLMKPGTLEKATGWAATSIIVDPTTEAEEKLKNPKGVKRDFFGTIFHFLKKRVATWGILAGVISWLASMGIGKYQSSVENPNPLLGTVAMVAKALIVAAPAASIYGQVMRNDRKVANIDPSIFLRSKGNEIINKFEFAKTVSEADLKDSKEKNIVLTPSEKSIEIAILQNVSKDKPVKSIIMGPESSCKSVLANKIATRVLESENASTDKQAVDIETIDCANVVIKLRQQASQNQPLKEVFSALTSQIPAMGSLIGDQLAEAIIYGIEQRIDEAKTQGNKRLVVQLRNVDALWKLAIKKDNSVDVQLISNIEAALCQLLNKDNKYDVVVTSNVPNDKTLGLSALCAEAFLKEHKIGGDMAIAVSALESELLSISALDDTTKIPVIASAIAQKFNINDESTKKALTAQVSKAIEYKLKGRFDEIIKEFDVAVTNSKKTGQPLYIDDYVQKIRDHYISVERFRKLGSGKIYSLMDKITIPDNVRNSLLIGQNDENSNEKKKIAALSIINDLINMSDNITSSERQKIEEDVRGNKVDLEKRRTDVENKDETCKKVYRDNEDTINYIKVICKKEDGSNRDDKDIIIALKRLQEHELDLFNSIIWVLNNCHEDEVKALKKQINDARMKALYN